MERKMGLNTTFDKAKIEYGDGEPLRSTWWTVAHVKGTECGFVAVNGDYNVMSDFFTTADTFWKKAVECGEVPADGKDRHGNKMQVDFVRQVSVPHGAGIGIPGMDSSEAVKERLAAVDLVHQKYREYMAQKGPDVRPA
jgi:hypothetical protein